MTNIITADFKNKLCAYTLQYRNNDFRLITKLVWAKNTTSARFQAFKDILNIEDVRTVLLFKVHPKNYKPTHRPEVVMLQNDIQEFYKSC